MKLLGRVWLAVALFVALPLAASETLMQCLTNCLPGVNPCSNCCFAQFDAAKGPCSDACQRAQKPCFDAAWASCEGSGDRQRCYENRSGPCRTAEWECQRNCDNIVRIAGGCPGEVQPQKCPYNCQTWNPAGQSCVGPAMNACGNTLASVAETDSVAEVRAARAKQAADAAAAHTEELKKIKPAKKSKKKHK